MVLVFLVTIPIIHISALHCPNRGGGISNLDNARIKTFFLLLPTVCPVLKKASKKYHEMTMTMYYTFLDLEINLNYPYLFLPCCI